MCESDPVRVLVVDDDRSLTEVYATWLAEHYTVDTVTSGTAALDTLDDDVDVVLLDRRMPDLPGERVLETIRERGYDCRVAMVTGVRPTEDIIEMGFDDYLVKPVDRDSLRAVVERLLERSCYDRSLREYYDLTSKRATIDSTASADDAGRVDHESIRAELDRRISALDDHLDETTTSFDPDDFRVAFRDLGSRRE